jgi:hypothetical protein
MTAATPSTATCDALVDGCMERLRADGIDKCHVFVLADNESGTAFWQDRDWSERDELRMFSRETGSAKR